MTWPTARAHADPKGCIDLPLVSLKTDGIGLVAPQIADVSVVP